MAYKIKTDKPKCWINQTSKTQRKMGSIQFINKSNNVQASVSKYDYSPKPRNYQVSITGVSEAKKGYPNTKVGITKKQAMKRLHNYIKKENC